MGVVETIGRRLIGPARRSSLDTHVIVFPNQEEYKKAVVAFLDVYVGRVALPDLKMVVSQEHIGALQRAGIQYQDLTKIAGNGTSPVQS